MKSLVTKKEERALRKFLSLSPVPEMTLSYYELRGYLYGIAITPDVIEPGEWMPLMFGDEAPVYESVEQARDLTSTLLTVLNKHIAAFNEQRLFMPFEMESIRDEDFENIVDWTSGLEEALALRPEFWDEYQGLSEDEHDLLMNSLVVVEGIVYPEDAIDMFDHLPRSEMLKIGINLSGNDIEKIAQIQYFMLQALELSVETIQDHAARLERLRREQLRASGAPFQLRSSSIGKNVDCPCGSGRKFKDCCSPQAGSPEGVARGSSIKKGKIIKVEFPRHGKKKPAPPG
ncbi:MAG TPA: UPF0149 family protein [Desulfopila sp.]|nr:UPF0149 family protein [Desulfopila sp.]